MATQVQWRGGSTAEHATFTGAAREVTVDTQKQTLVLHDGSTAGGRALLREDGSNAALALGSAGTPSLKFTGDTNTGIYSPGADQLALVTGGNERARITGTGQLRLAGAGITFNGDTATANELDDYEEGTWTPSISNTGFTYTYSNQTGTYTKVGRTVTLSWRVAVTARSGSASGGLPTVVIPFTASASFTGSALHAQHPAQLVIHKASTASTSGIRTFLYSGFANGANAYFWIAAIASNGDPFDIGSDFHLGGVFTYEV